MSKTKPTYRATKFGILSVKEIEVLITDGIANVNAFLLREFTNLSIGVKTAKELHEKIAGHDYNGRVARLLGQLFLLQHKLPISSFVGIKRTDFASAMKKATAEHNTESAINLINKSIQ